MMREFPSTPDEAFAALRRHIESDRFQNLSYSKQVFETEAGAVYGEYRKNRTNPFFTVYEAMREYTAENPFAE